MIIVTGGSGLAGRAVVKDLVEHGYEGASVDMALPPAGQGVPFSKVDLTDYGQALAAFSGIDDRFKKVTGIIHLAAIPAPGLAPNHVIFEANILSTYNVFEAARVLGIRNVVWASSETVLGIPFETPPPYVPVDEEYPARPESVYSLVKHLEEQMAIELCRWHRDLSITALRFSNVMDVADYAGFPAFDADPGLRKWNLWSYIDGRDGAAAVELALTRQGGFDRFIVASPDTVMSRPNAELVAEVFPGVPTKGELGVHDTLLSIDKARRILRYDPQHSWRDHT